MASYRQLCAKAKEMGHELTPTLKAELKLLSAISDEEINAAYKGAVTKRLAKEFRVSPVIMEHRLGDSIPSLTRSSK